MKVSIIGAGILGLTAAYELSGRGHEVILIDRDHAFAGASHRSFAWINANNKTPSSYHRMNVLGVEEHKRLHADLPAEQTWLHMSGNILLDFSESNADTYASRIADAEAEGYPVTPLQRPELQKLEPSVRWPESVESALYYTNEGYLDNDLLGEALVGILRQRGIEVHQAQVQRVESLPAGGTIVFTTGQRLATDRVVIAAGAGTRQIADASGYRIPVADLETASTRTHSLLGLTEPTNVGVRRVITSDRINVRPRHDGRMWVQVPYIEHRVAEGDSPELRSAVAWAMRHELEHLFGIHVPVEKVIFSGRSFPEDGHSIIGFVDESRKVYSVVTHSGMTLAALFARLTADELEGGTARMLDDFRPTRFDGGVGSSDDSYFIGKQ